MDALQQQLAKLSPEQVAQLLGASGHAQLLQPQSTDDVNDDANDATKRTLDAEQARQRGNDSFRSKDFASAVEAYSAAIALDPRNAVSLSNRAAAHLKLGDYESAIDDCTRAIELAPSIKPYMRRATAYIERRDYASAVYDLVAALTFEPDNRECVAKLSMLATEPPRTAVDTITTTTAAVVDRRARIAAALAVAVRRGWQPVAVTGNPAPPALNGHALVSSASGRVLLFGGRSVRDHAPQVFALDERDWSWDVVPTTGDSPTARAWHSLSRIDPVAPSNAQCVVYGGVSALGEDSRVYVLAGLDNSLKWSQPLSVVGDAPSARSGHSAVRIPSALGPTASPSSDTESVTLVFGGRTKRGVSDELFVLRTAQKANGVACVWETVPRTEPWPAPRDGHSMCVLPALSSDDYDPNDTRVLLYGGNGQQNDDKFGDVWVFHTRSQQWQQLHCTSSNALSESLLPAARSYHTAHMIGSCMVVVGGRMRDAEDADVHVLDTVTCEWLRAPIPTTRQLAARAWHASVVTADTKKLYVLGGGTFTGPRKDAAVLDLAAFAALMDEIDSSSA